MNYYSAWTTAMCLKMIGDESVKLKLSGRNYKIFHIFIV